MLDVVSHPNTVQIVDFGVLPSGQSWRGRIFEEQQRRSEAMAEYQKAVRLPQGPTNRSCSLATEFALTLGLLQPQKPPPVRLTTLLSAE